MYADPIAGNYYCSDVYHELHAPLSMYSQPSMVHTRRSPIQMDIFFGVLRCGTDREAVLVLACIRLGCTMHEAMERREQEFANSALPMAPEAAHPSEISMILEILCSDTDIRATTALACLRSGGTASCVLEHLSTVASDTGNDDQLHVRRSLPHESSWTIPHLRATITRSILSYPDHDAEKACPGSAPKSGLQLPPISGLMATLEEPFPPDRCFS